jgi:hypothetical protein
MFKFLKNTYDKWKRTKGGKITMSALMHEMLQDPDTREQLSKHLDDPYIIKEGVITHKGKEYKIKSVGAMQWLK